MNLPCRRWAKFELEPDAEDDGITQHSTGDSATDRGIVSAEVDALGGVELRGGAASGTINAHDRRVAYKCDIGYRV